MQIFLRTWQEPQEPLTIPHTIPIQFCLQNHTMLFFLHLDNSIQVTESL